MAVAGALVVLAAAPASAVTMYGWYYSDGYHGVNGCYVFGDIGTNNVTASESGSCPGEVYAQAYWTPNGINYYASTIKHGPSYAVAGQTTSVAIKVGHD